MNEILTIDEINEQYPDEWVVIADPEKDHTGRPIRGRVISHGKDRSVVYGKAAKLGLPRSAAFYTGRAPEGMEYVL